MKANYLMKMILVPERIFELYSGFSDNNIKYWVVPIE